MEIPAGEFKAKCLKLMELVASTREPIIITKRGRPVAKLMPPDDPAPRQPLFGYMAGAGEVRGDLISIDSAWSAVAGEEDDLYPMSSPAPGYRVAEGRAPRKHK